MDQASGVDRCLGGEGGALALVDEGDEVGGGLVPVGGALDGVAGHGCVPATVTAVDGSGGELVDGDGVETLIFAPSENVALLSFHSLVSYSFDSLVCRLGATPSRQRKD
ncbi:hypothetical protein [Streptomyces tendae]|uniref:hypothetical protein n=1 Tax=Streptomyces tendae TaxID=1932 RepID=UPI0036BCE3A9